MKSKGTIIKWNDDKGYGFIREGNGTNEVFFHISEIKQKWVRPKIGNKVAYHVSTEKDGKLRANAIEITNLKLTDTGSGKALLMSGAFLALVGMAVVTKYLPVIVLGVYLVMSLVTFIYYAHDKKRAKKEQSRVPEFTLHALSLFFGWPGANIAQQYLRHKSVKARFRVFFYITIAMNCLFIAYLLHPYGHWLNKALSAIVSLPSMQ